MTTVEKPSPNSAAARASRAEYDELLERLSDGSIHRSFDPYQDIDWNAPEFAVV